MWQHFTSNPGKTPQNLFPNTILTCKRDFPLYNAGNPKRKGKPMKFEIIENAKRQARMCFLGIAIPTEVKNIDGEMIQVEKVLKFNRKALRSSGKVKVEKADPRLVGGEDRMIHKVGKPGSKERVNALALQYASLAENEVSAFAED
jgi:hypothetical protein